MGDSSTTRHDLPRGRQRLNRNYANSIEAAAEKMAKHFNTFGTAKVKQTKVKIYRKKLYKQRFKMRPDELGLARVRSLFDRHKQITPILFTRKTEAALA